MENPRSEEPIRSVLTKKEEPIKKGGGWLFGSNTAKVAPMSEEEIKREAENKAIEAENKVDAANKPYDAARLYSYNRVYPNATEVPAGKKGGKPKKR